MASGIAGDWSATLVIAAALMNCVVRVNTRNLIVNHCRRVPISLCMLIGMLLVSNAVAQIVPRPVNDAQVRPIVQDARRAADGIRGLRIVSSGHSWVAPALKTLPRIALADGLSRHQQRYHIRGAAGGSAIAIWAIETGLFGKKREVLKPLIADGSWDVMTLGAFYHDRAAYYVPWFDYCLKHNPDMIFYIQDGWPRVPSKVKHEDLTLDMFKPEQKKIDDMMLPVVDELRKNYPSKVRVIPVGLAMCEMLRLYFAGELPGIDGVSQHLGQQRCLYSDGSHLCEASGMQWFEGYVYYASLYKKSPELVDVKSTVFNRELDETMRRVAWKAVVDYPLAGIDDDNMNGVADEIEEAASAP